jgi:hypothetical protein
VSASRSAAGSIVASGAASSRSPSVSSSSPIRLSLMLLDPALTTSTRNCLRYMSAEVSEPLPEETATPPAEPGHTQSRTSGGSSPNWRV